MNSNKYLLPVFFLFYLLMSLSVTAFSQQSNQPPKEVQTAMFLIEQERKYEKQMTDYLQNDILDKIFGKGKSTILYDVEFELNSQATRTEAKEKALERKRNIGDIEYILPGIPKPSAISQQELPGDSKEEAGQQEIAKISTKIDIKKQSATVIYDETIKDDKVNIVREIIISALGIDTKRGDKLEFRKAKFTVPVITPTSFEEFLKPNYVIPLIIVMLLLLFLFGPVSSFLKNYIQTMRERGGQEIILDSNARMENTGTANPAGQPGLETATGESATLSEEEKKKKEQEELEKKKKEEEKYIPFDYVNEENLRRLIYLLSKEKPEIIVLVLSYLKPEFVREILTNLPPELQAEVALNLITPKEMSKEEVMTIDNQIKEKINYLVGGFDQLLKIIDQVDLDTVTNILEYLQKEKPELYDKVRKYVFLFEDIPNIPDIAFQTVIRELKIENIAKALQNADKKIVDKFFNNMSAGAVSLLQEEMNYAGSLKKEQIEEERKKIVNKILQLEKEGKIYIRERGKSLLTEALSFKQEPGERTKSVQVSADEYYSYGVSLFEEGKYEEAIPYFEYSLQINPDNWLSYQYLGNAYYQLGKYNEAVSYFEKVLEFNPPDAESLRKWVDEFKKTTIST